MKKDPPNKRTISFDRSPVSQVPLEVISYVMTLPEEARVSLGNFLLDSSVDGFDDIAETPAQLWKNETERRIEDAIAHPENLIPADQVFERLRRHLDQIRRTPWPDHLHGYHCREYFSDGWAEKGLYDEASHCWLINPISDLDDGFRSGFFAVGGPGVDGIMFCYRFGHHGLWAFYPMEKEFVFLAPTLAEFVEGWKSGKITV